MNAVTPMEEAGSGRRATYDVAVIGGGAAGLNGALALARARRSVVVVDAGDPRNAPAAHVHNYLGREGSTPAELYGTGRAEVSGYGGTVLQGDTATIRRDADGLFRVLLTDGRELRARRILAASGVRDRLPELPGLAERWGSTVLHCPYCHGWEVRDKAIGILAVDMDAAMHQALLWRQISADVVVFLHTAGEPEPAQAEQLAARGIRTVAGPVEGVERQADVRLSDGRLVERDALVVLTYLEARAGYLAGLGLEPAEQFMGKLAFGTSIPADPTGATPVPGVYAAGNLAVPMAQVIASASSGLMAGAAINADLVAEETGLAVAALAGAAPAEA